MTGNFNDKWDKTPFPINWLSITSTPISCMNGTNIEVIEDPCSADIEIVSPNVPESHVEMW